MRRLSSWCCAAVLTMVSGAFAQAPDKISDGVVKIGVLTDMSGFLADASGKGGVTAVRMAVADFGGTVLGKPIEVIAADNLNKADVAANLARQWYDVDHVDMIIDLGNSATALSAIAVARQKNGIAIATLPGTTRITNEDCGPTSIHYGYDSYALAKGIAKTLVKNGLDTWYFITIDFAGGRSIEEVATAMIKESGGKVLGAARHPMDTTDFSSFILQAQASRAKVIGFASAGSSAINAIKTAREFGLAASGQTLAGLYIFLSDIPSLGLDAAQGMYVTTGFYWDADDGTRKWSKRYFEQTKRMPTMVQAADYSATLHYLEAVRAAGTDETSAVMKKMKELPVNDFFARGGKIREDGLLVHDMYLTQVKKPSESRYPWDYYSIKKVIPGDQAFQPLAKGTCSLVKK